MKKNTIVLYASACCILAVSSLSYAMKPSFQESMLTTPTLNPLREQRHHRSHHRNAINLKNQLQGAIRTALKTSDDSTFQQSCKIIKELIKKGANVNRNTALENVAHHSFHASINRCKIITSYLIRQGARITQSTFEALETKKDILLQENMKEFLYIPLTPKALQKEIKIVEEGIKEKQKQLKKLKKPTQKTQNLLKKVLLRKKQKEDPLHQEILFHKELVEGWQIRIKELDKLLRRKQKALKSRDTINHRYEKIKKFFEKKKKLNRQLRAQQQKLAIHNTKKRITCIKKYIKEKFPPRRLPAAFREF